MQHGSVLELHQSALNIIFARSLFVADWMQAIRLQLNTSKTEILWCSTTRKRDSLPSAAVRVGADLVTPSSTVRELGIAIDSDVTMQTHVSKTVSACFAVLRQLRSITPLVI